MKRLTRFNFILDALLFLVMAAIGGIGLLMRFKLVSGEERWEIYGSNPELYMFGLDRHQWGDLHLYLGYAFFVLLFFHIILHWRQIKGIFRKMVPARAGQAAVVFSFVIVSLFLLSFAFVGPVTVDPLHQGAGRGRLESFRDIQGVAQGVSGTALPAGRGLQRTPMAAPPGDADVAVVEEPEAEKPGEDIAPAVLLRRSQEALREEHDDHEERNLEIFGTSTISEVAARYGVPAEAIKQAFGISSDVPDSERLGRLRRRYGFNMSDVERFVLDYRHSNRQ